MKAKQTPPRIEFFLLLALVCLLAGCQPDEDWEWLIVSAPVVSLVLVFVLLCAVNVTRWVGNQAFPHAVMLTYKR